MVMTMRVRDVPADASIDRARLKRLAATVAIAVALAALASAADAQSGTQYGPPTQLSGPPQIQQNRIHDEHDTPTSDGVIHVIHLKDGSMVHMRVNNKTGAVTYLMF